MPKFHELSVNAGDRNTLMRFALIARLSERPSGEATKRGSPKLPLELLDELGIGSQRQFTNFVYHSNLLAHDALKAIEAVDRETPSKTSLVDLRRDFVAARDPAEVALGVSGEYWPLLRTIPISRHPVDTVMSACAAANYLQHADPTPRDNRTIDRLQSALCRIAVGGYSLSPRAIDLIAILSRWRADKPISEVGFGKRRLARALDRAIRTYVQPEAWGPLAQSRRQEEFGKLFGKIARRMETMMALPHTATSSSAPLLRLARIIVRYHDPNDSDEKKVALQLSRNLFDLCMGPVSGSTHTTDDIMLRRECLLYLVEMKAFIDSMEPTTRPSKMQIPELINTLRHEDALGQFTDILDFAESMTSVEWVSATQPSGALREDQFGADVVTTLSISASSWPIANAPFKGALLTHLPLGEEPPSGWRDLTKQVALPTRDLLVEILTTPATGRARTIGETLRHAGYEVRSSVTGTLSRMLSDEAVISHPVIARRAIWVLGFAGTYSPEAATTLVELALNSSVDYCTSADAAWALGDVISGVRDATAESALLALREIVESTASDVKTDIEHTSNRLIRTQAALHALAIQRWSDDVSTFSSFIGSSEDMLTGPQPAEVRLHLGRCKYLAQWGMELVDSPPALALARVE